MTYMMVIIVPTKFCFNYIRLKRTAKEVKMSSVFHKGNVTKMSPILTTFTVLGPLHWSGKTGLEQRFYTREISPNFP